MTADNHDVINGWQRYPGELANFARRLGINVATYAMTH
jgi:hypothetical protein